MRVVVSTSAAVRLGAARRFLQAFPPSTEALVVAASRGAADDFARSVAASSGATFGLDRFSFSQLAAKAAARRLASLGRVPATMLSGEALAARASFEVGDGLAYFTPVARFPGFPRAVARTLDELRQAGLEPPALSGRGAAEDDLAALLTSFVEQADLAAAFDRAALFALASEACEDALPWPAGAVLLLDVPLESVAERRFAKALGGAVRDAFATVPAGDEATIEALESGGAVVERAEDDADESTDVGRLRRYVFGPERPGEREAAGDVEVFSGPGEGRESLEIARRVLEEARRGVAFDEIAVFVRSPRDYVGLLEYAFERAGIPAYFDRGTRRPDPSGRAFVALVSCAVEKLSAKRFDEYLSLGQVPTVAQSLGEPILPGDELVAAMLGPNAAEPFEPFEPLEPPEPSEPLDEDAIVAGSLRAPWKWEELIVESAVIGGRERWRRRLDGLQREYERRIGELEREEPESPRIRRYRRDLRNLEHLRGFALPIVDMLDGWWVQRHPWGVWLDRFAALAPRVLKTPGRVQRILADLRPMAGVGPLSLEEARDVLAERLVLLEREPPSSRYGAVFVGSPHQARGRVFRTVFVPGLAERMFPQRLREDPLLLDESRRRLDRDLLLQDDRAKTERLLLRLAIGAATERLFVSYPRLQVADSRARVPSFYLLDIARAIRGFLPEHQMLQREAAEAGAANLAWPAPVDPSRALDDLEHDLATLRRLLDDRDRTATKGRAHYLLQLNDALRRSVIVRYERNRPAWRASDGIVAPTDGTRPVLAAERLTSRPYSLSALQRFATCPYQFLLSAVFRLEPWDEPEPLQRLDPLTRGSLFHRIQAEFFRALRAERRLPVTAAALSTALDTLDAIVEREASAAKEELAPAIDRVWNDEIEEMRQDLKVWVTRMAGDTEWTPEYFEFSFGLSDAGRDEASVGRPVLVGDRFWLRGSVDLIEARSDGALRVTDHKTGKNRTTTNLVIGGGKVLQPVVYSMAVERVLGRTVVNGRLSYCTKAGGFSEHVIPLNDHARRAGGQALAIVDRSIELGFLAPAPDRNACRWCDFRTVCGPNAAARAGRKAKDRLADLLALRGEP